MDRYWRIRFWVRDIKSQVDDWFRYHLTVDDFKDCGCIDPVNLFWNEFLPFEGHDADSSNRAPKFVEIYSLQCGDEWVEVEIAHSPDMFDAISKLVRDFKKGHKVIEYNVLDGAKIDLPPKNGRGRPPVGLEWVERIKTEGATRELKEEFLASERCRNLSDPESAWKRAVRKAGENQQ